MDMKEDNGLYGYTGRQLRINLTNGKIIAEDVDEQLLREYIGGVGYGAYLHGTS